MIDGGAFEGDLIRPLGLVTLYFGYAEFEANALLEGLREVGLLGEVPAHVPLGQKLAFMREVLTDVQLEGARDVIAILEGTRQLLALRNSLVHSTILAKGRVESNDGAERDFLVTPQKLADLAEQIFAWKERLSVTFQRQLLLCDSGGIGV